MLHLSYNELKRISTILQYHLQHSMDRNNDFVILEKIQNEIDTFRYFDISSTRVHCDDCMKHHALYDLEVWYDEEEEDFCFDCPNVNLTLLRVRRNHNENDSE